MSTTTRSSARARHAPGAGDLVVRMTASVLAVFLISSGWWALDARSNPATAQDVCDGVWVVVDGRAIGGSLRTGCAVGDPPNGVAALEQAGFASTFVPNQPGFVCTIDRRPDPCNMAPADAYWSYWHAPTGGSWSYANTGAGSRDPEPGTVEGWRFGDGSMPPGIAAPAAPEPDPEPPPASTEDPGAGGAVDNGTDAADDGVGDAGEVDGERTAESGSDSVVEDRQNADPERDPTDGARSSPGDEPDVVARDRAEAEAETEAETETETDGADADGADANATSLGTGDAAGTTDALASRDETAEGGIPGIVVAAVLLGALGGATWWQRRARVTA